jgi:hypothetical protein
LRLPVAPKGHTEAKKLACPLYVPVQSTWLTSDSQALIRDNYRCMLSGVVDISCAESLPELQVELSTHGVGKRTQCCHILPQDINRGHNDEIRVDISLSP